MKQAFGGLNWGRAWQNATACGAFDLIADLRTPEIKHLAQAQLLLLDGIERTNAWRSCEQLSVENTMHTIPPYHASDGNAEISPSPEGVTLMELEDCDTIHVRTRNNDYEIFLLDPKSGRALVRGGECFAEPVEATVSGSTLGGCMLRLGWLGVGFRMEIYVAGERTVTSPVQSLRVERVDRAWRNAAEFIPPFSFHPTAENCPVESGEEAQGKFAAVYLQEYAVST